MRSYLIGLVRLAGRLRSYDMILSIFDSTQLGKVMDTVGFDGLPCSNVKFGSEDKQN